MHVCLESVKLGLKVRIMRDGFSKVLMNIISGDDLPFSMQQLRVSLFVDRFYFSVQTNHFSLASFLSLILIANQKRHETRRVGVGCVHCIRCDLRLLPTENK